MKWTHFSFDKDAFTNEKMGILMFDYRQLMELGEDIEEKRWFDLTDCKSGEIQLSIRCVGPEPVS